MKKINLSNTIKNFKEKMTFKKSIKEIIKSSIKCIKKSSLWLLILISPIILINLFQLFKIIGILGISFTFVGFSSAIIGGLFGLIDVVDKYLSNKEATKDINTVIEEFKQVDMNLTQDMLKKAEVKEILNKETFSIENGKKIKKRKVVEYICLNYKDKLKIIKQLTLTTQDKFKETNDILLKVMNDNDLVNEGILNESGELTKKAKVLGIKLVKGV